MSNTDTKKELGHNLRAYLTGFGLSVVLTLTAFFIAHRGLSSRGALVAVLIALALSQFVVQMYFFLHLGQEEKPRLKLTTFWFMLIVVIIIVLGSLWIMRNLNYNMMQSPQETRQYLSNQDGL
jgi:cytochrome o ubiquinol oxidase operon protein cyoD